MKLIPQNWSLSRYLLCAWFHGGWYNYSKDKHVDIKRCKTCNRAFWWMK